jgi:hypothetical protein
MLVALAETRRSAAAVFVCVDKRLMTAVKAEKVRAATVRVARAAGLAVPSVLLLFLLV